VSKHSKKNAARRRQDKALRNRTEKREAKAALNAKKAKDGSKATKLAAKASEKRRRQRKAAELRISHKVAACKSMKELKELAKKVGVQGYSSWTAAQRSEAEACIIATALDFGVA